MRKSALIIVLALLLTGCGTREAAPVEPDFSIPLPEGYTAAPATEHSVSILRGEETVGGIHMTELGDDIRDLEDGALFRYIDSFAPVPLIGEYMAMFWDQEGYTYIHVTLKITDPETEAVQNQQHYLFQHSGAIYDLWLDDALVDEDQQKQFRISAQLAPAE